MLHGGRGGHRLAIGFSCLSHRDKGISVKCWDENLIEPVQKKMGVERVETVSMDSLRSYPRKGIKEIKGVVPGAEPGVKEGLFRDGR